MLICVQIVPEWGDNTAGCFLVVLRVNHVLLV